MAYERHLSKQVAIQWALESTYGVDPNAGYKYALVDEGAKVDQDSTAIQRKVVSSRFGGKGVAVTALTWKGSSLALELKALGRSGGAIVEPEFMIGLQACAVNKLNGYVLTLSGITGTFERGEDISISSVVVGKIYDIEGTTLFVRKTGSTAITSSSTIDGETSAATATVSAVLTALVCEPILGPQELREQGKSISMRTNEDGIEKQLVGVVATATINCPGKEIPRITIEPRGLYTPPTDTAMVHGDVSGVEPLPFEGVGFKFGDLDGSKVMLTNATLDLGCTVTMPNDSQQSDSIAFIGITELNPKLKLEFSVPNIATYDPYTEYKNSVVRHVSITYGKTDKFIRLCVPRAQITAAPTSNDKDGYAHYSLDMEAKAGTSDADTPNWSMWWW